MKSLILYTHGCHRTSFRDCSSSSPLSSSSFSSSSLFSCSCSCNSCSYSCSSCSCFSSFSSTNTTLPIISLPLRRLLLFLSPVSPQHPLSHYLPPLYFLLLLPLSSHLISSPLYIHHSRYPRPFPLLFSFFYFSSSSYFFLLLLYYL